MERIDLVFSYWIFAWFIAYFFDSSIVSPFIALSVGILDNAIMLFLMFMYHIPWIQIAVFVGINIFIKIIPMWWLLRHDHSKNYVQQIISLVVLLAIYTVWLWFNHESYAKNTANFFHGLKHGSVEDVFTPYVRHILDFVTAKMKSV